MQVTHEQEYTITESTTTSLDTSFAQSVEVSYGAGLNVGVFNANSNVTIGAHFGQSIHKGETVENTTTNTYAFNTIVSPGKTVHGTAVIFETLVDVPWEAEVRVYFAGQTGFKTRIILGKLYEVQGSRIVAKYDEPKGPK